MSSSFGRRLQHQYHICNEQNPAWYRQISSVTIVTRPLATIPQNSGSIASSSKRSFSFPQVQPGRVAHISPCSMGSLPGYSEVKNARNRNSTLPLSLRNMNRIEFARTLFFYGFHPIAYSLLPVQHVGCYNWDEVCLLRGTDWVTRT